MMQDEGKILAQVYELIVGKEVANAIVKVFQKDKMLAVQIMGVTMKAVLSDMPAAEVRKEIDLLIADYEQPQGSMTGEE